jgi:hypothetical protein
MVSRRTRDSVLDRLFLLGAMKVHELIKALQAWPDQDATVILGEGMRLDRWIIASGIVARRIAADRDNPDLAVPGAEAGVEIV